MNRLFSWMSTLLRRRLLVLDGSAGEHSLLRHCYCEVMTDESKRIGYGEDIYI